MVAGSGGGIGVSVCSLKDSLVLRPLDSLLSCHCQRKTKACDLSMCSVTALKTDAKPQGSSLATLFEGSADWGWGGSLGIPPKTARAGGGGWVGGRIPL